MSVPVVLSRGSIILLALASCEFPEPPLETVGPVDEIEMADTNQGPLVVTPLARLDTE
jgi:hypothetical protein